VVALSLVIALVAILLVNESSHLAKAADGPKTVWGVVYDGTDQPVAGATVTVSMKYGLGSTRSQLSFGPTDVDGYYLVVFDRSQWMEHDTIEVTATRSGGDSATNSTDTRVREPCVCDYVPMSCCCVHLRWAQEAQAQCPSRISVRLFLSLSPQLASVCRLFRGTAFQVSHCLGLRRLCLTVYPQKGKEYIERCR